MPNKTNTNIKQALFVGSSADLHKIENKNKDVQSEEDKKAKHQTQQTDVSDNPNLLKILILIL